MSRREQILPAESNQARGLAQYALDAVAGRLGEPSPAVYAQVERFHLDSVACAVAALGLGTNAPRLLREEALECALAAGRPGACCFGSNRQVPSEKAVAANAAAVRELDANGTNFGYNPKRGATRGEFGHNDYYPVVLAAAETAGLDGPTALRGMIYLDEIRARLAEVFALRDYKIDHVVHGAIASAAIYGALVQASAEQIESAIGMLVAHYVPFRAIRAGKQLSDSKGASAALSAEAAVLCVRRAMRGFVGPADIFRNPQAIFCLFEPPKFPDRSPFDLVLTCQGEDFAVMGMHFKLGIYEHQSAGAIQALMDLLAAHPRLMEDPGRLRRITVVTYEPAYSIIGDPSKRDPRNRQTADHSMVYILATLLRKAYESRTAGWNELMLVPADYDPPALAHPLTRQIMRRIDFRHGGAEYDRLYPDGIPTSLTVEHEQLGTLDSGLVMYPQGHARNQSGNLEAMLEHKFRVFAGLGVEDPDALRRRFSNLAEKSADQIASLMDFPLRCA